MTTLFLLLFSTLTFANENPLRQYTFPAQASCVKEVDSDEFVYSNDFKWGVTLQEMKKKFGELYNSKKRLKNRAYFDKNRGVYIMEFKNPIGPAEGWYPVVLPPHFVNSVRKHVELALEKRYADFIFFPDMGHSHFYFPKKYEGELQKVSAIERTDKIYQWLVNLPDLKMLYHTAEQLKVTSGESKQLVSDKEILWRYFTRNPVGDNKGGESISPIYAWDNDKYNSINNLEGHKDWSSGFNIHANAQGCFPYTFKGKTYYFDLSWYDLTPAPGSDPGDYGVNSKSGERIPASKKKK